MIVCKQVSFIIIIHIHALDLFIFTCWFYVELVSQKGEKKYLNPNKTLRNYSGEPCDGSTLPWGTNHHLHYHLAAAVDPHYGKVIPLSLQPDSLQISGEHDVMLYFWRALTAYSYQVQCAELPEVSPFTILLATVVYYRIQMIASTTQRQSRASKIRKLTLGVGGGRAGRGRMCGRRLHVRRLRVEVVAHALARNTHRSINMKHRTAIVWVHKLDQNHVQYIRSYPLARRRTQSVLFCKGRMPTPH